MTAPRCPECGAGPGVDCPHRAPDIAPRTSLTAILRAELAGLGCVLDPDRLELVGLRRHDARPDRWDDTVCAVLGDTLHRWRCTTRPGRTHLRAPMNPAGTAILVPRRYLDAYELGTHRGRPALRQASPLAVWRDNDRDELPEGGGRVFWGMFGAHVHGPWKDDLERVGASSAGCQVVDSTEAIADLVALCSASGAARWSYTLATTAEAPGLLAVALPLDV